MDNGTDGLGLSRSPGVVSCRAVPRRRGVLCCVAPTSYLLSRESLFQRRIAFVSSERKEDGSIEQCVRRNSKVFPMLYPSPLVFVLPP